MKTSLTGHDKGVPISMYIQIIQTMTSNILLLNVKVHIISRLGPAKECLRSS